MKLHDPMHAVQNSLWSQAGDFYRRGVAIERGGIGGQLADAVETIMHLAEQAPATATRIWAQRVLIECLLRGDNVALCEYQLPNLLDGSVAGTTGLWRHIVRPGEAVAVGVTGRVRRIDATGRVGSREAGSATLELDDVHFREDEIIASDGTRLVAEVRTASVALGCGILAGQIRTMTQQNPELSDPSCAAQLSRLVDELRTGLPGDAFAQDPSRLMAIHRQLVRLGARRV